MNLFLLHVFALSFIFSRAVLHTPQNLQEFYTSFSRAYGTEFHYQKAPCFGSSTASEFLDLFSELAGRAVLNKNTSQSYSNLLQRDRDGTIKFINDTLKCMIDHQETVMMFGSFDEYIINPKFFSEELPEFLEVFPEDSYLLFALMDFYTAKQDYNRTALTLALLFQQTKQYQKGFIKYTRDLTKDDPVNASAVEYSNFLKGLCKVTQMPCFYDSKLCWEFEDSSCVAKFFSNLTEVALEPKENLAKNIKQFIEKNAPALRSCVDKDTWECEKQTGDYMTFKWRFHGSFWNSIDHMDQFAKDKPDEMIFYLKTLRRYFVRQNYELIGTLMGPIIEYGAEHIPKPHNENAMPMDSNLLTMGYNNEL